MNNENVLTIKDLDDFLEALNIKKPIIYSAVCFKCGGSFLSYEQINNFFDCTEHINNDEYYNMMTGEIL